MFGYHAINETAINEFPVFPPLDVEPGGLGALLAKIFAIPSYQARITCQESYQGLVYIKPTERLS